MNCGFKDFLGFWRGLICRFLFLNGRMFWRDFSYRRGKIFVSISTIKRFVINEGVNCTVDGVSVLVCKVYSAVHLFLMKMGMSPIMFVHS